MNKTKIKNEIKSEHQIFKGKIVQIVNCEVQYWSDYFPQPTEFEFIVENAEAKKMARMRMISVGPILLIISVCFWLCRAQS